MITSFRRDSRQRRTPIWNCGVRWLSVEINFVSSFQLVFGYVYPKDCSKALQEERIERTTVQNQWNSQTQKNQEIDYFEATIEYFALSWHSIHWTRSLNRLCHSKICSRKVVEYRTVSSIFVQIDLNDVVQISSRPLLGASPDRWGDIHEKHVVSGWVVGDALFSPPPRYSTENEIQETRSEISSYSSIFWEDEVLFGERRRPRW